VWVHTAFADSATFAFDIPREDLALALNQIAQQSHIEISYSAELTRGKISPLLKASERFWAACAPDCRWRFGH
jgi:hypothetical protein